MDHGNYDYSFDRSFQDPTYNQFNAGIDDHSASTPQRADAEYEPKDIKE